MRILTEEQILGYSYVENVLYAQIDRSGSVKLGDLYRVPKEYITSGVGKVTNIDGYNVTKGNSEVSFWLIDLEAALVEPDDPCDDAFMEEISS